MSIMWRFAGVRASIEVDNAFTIHVHDLSLQRKGVNWVEISCWGFTPL